MEKWRSRMVFTVLFFIVLNKAYCLNIYTNNCFYFEDNQERRVKEYCLILLRNCLAFDFIGTTPDESGEDVGSIQVS
jgi:hypothetical protein